MKKEGYMSRNITLLILFSLVVAGGCKSDRQDKYSEMRSYIGEIIALQSDYAANLEKAENPKDVAESIDIYADSLVEISKKGKKIEERYPELKNMDKKNPPEELKSEFEKLNKVSGQIAARSLKQMEKYSTDKEVIQAIQRMGKKLMDAQALNQKE